jgi:hypothetical protein
MEKCFVIQPFDKDKFDQRYADIFKPAIDNASLKPYRIDHDLSTRIPIEDIEKEIAESVLCFADITVDNPNVWYELGYAFACGKDVVIVCSDERTGKFPFDIQHRHVITYKTRSTSDFKSLEESITAKIKAMLQTTKTAKSLNATPVVETEGLQSNEIAIIILVADYQFLNEGPFSVYSLKSDMERSGYNTIATGIGIQTLKQKGMLTTSFESDYQSNGDTYMVCSLTEKGVTWILSNQDKLVFRKDDSKNQIIKSPDEDDLPF